jgi:hypothetical protein
MLGKAKCLNALEQGMIGHSDVPDWSFIYKASVIKDPQWNIGDRVVTPDGRVFRYAKVGTAGVLSSFGATVRASSNISVLAPAQQTLNAGKSDQQICGAVGSRVVTITIASGDGRAADGVVAKDELKGGYIVLNNQGSSAQCRCILGNTAVASGGGTTIVTLDGPLTAAVVASTTYTEILLNPYAFVEIFGGSNAEYQSAIGVPAVTATVGQYVWLQTWGPLWVVPGGNTTPGDSVNDREVVFVGDGSINGSAHITNENGYQVAGFIMDSGSTTPPFIMLQISI